MDFAEVSRSRRMVRAFDPDRVVAAEVLDDLVSVALRAPSAGDSQGVSLLVLSSPERVAAYWLATTVPGPADRWLRGMRTAPALILVWTSRDAYLDRYAEPDKGWTDRDESRWSAPYWFVDAGMSSMAVLLSAVDSGIGACFFGVPRDRMPAVRSAFGVPEEQISVGAIAVGYPDPQLGRSPGSPRRRRRPDRVHLGRWATSFDHGDSVD